MTHGQCDARPNNNNNNNIIIIIFTEHSCPSTKNSIVLLVTFCTMQIVHWVKLDYTVRVWVKVLSASTSVLTHVRSALYLVAFYCNQCHWRFTVHIRIRNITGSWQSIKLVNKSTKLSIHQSSSHLSENHTPYTTAAMQHAKSTDRKAHINTKIRNCGCKKAVFSLSDVVRTPRLTDDDYAVRHCVKMLVAGKHLPERSLN